MELLTKIIDEKLCEGNASAQQAIDELKVLFEYLECYGATNKVTPHVYHLFIYISLLMLLFFSSPLLSSRK